MRMVVVSLKRTVLVFTMKPCISPGKRSMLTVTHGKYFLRSSTPVLSLAFPKIFNSTAVRKDLDCTFHQLMDLLGLD